MKLKDALQKLEIAQRRHDHMPTTRQDYQRTIIDYAKLIQSGTIDGPQAYVDYLADTRHLHQKTIRTISEQLGHTDIRTTLIYLASAGFRATASPMDRTPADHTQNIIPLRKLA